MVKERRFWNRTAGFFFIVALLCVGAVFWHAGMVVGGIAATAAVAAIMFSIAVTEWDRIDSKMKERS